MQSNFLPVMDNENKLLNIIIKRQMNTVRLQDINADLIMISLA